MSRAVARIERSASRDGWYPRSSGRVCLLTLLLAAGHGTAVTARAAENAGAAAVRQTSGEIRGRVSDLEGRPLAGVLVSVVGSGRSALTDRHGSFRLDGLPAGSQTLHLRMGGYRDQEVTVEVGSGGGVVETALESTPLELPGVVVTASPVRGRAGYQATQVLRGEQLQRLSSASVGTVLASQPGVAARYFGAAPARPVIRGFDGERVIVLENGERMGDKQRAPDDAVTLDPLAIDRVEVVRGPASLLYGSSAIGGVVNLFTRDLPENWAPGVSGDVALEAASVNEMRAAASRVLYGAEQWGFAARTSLRHGRDFGTPGGAMPNSHLQTFAGSAGVGYQSTGFRGGVSASLHAQEYGVPEFAVESDPAAPNRFLEVAPESENVLHRAAVQSRGEWNLSRWIRTVEFRASASKSDQEEGHGNGGDHEEAEDEIEEEVHQQIGIRLFGSTVLLRHAPLGVFDQGALGFSLRHQHQEMEGSELFHPGERLLSVAGFFLEEIPLGSTVRLQFGSRIENEWVRTLPNALFAADASSKVAALNVSGSLGLNFKPTEPLEVGIQLARAHRNPSVVERYASGWHFGSARVEIGEPDLPSEVGHGFDLFGRYTSDRLRLELASFAYRIRNYVALRNLPPGCGGIDYRLRPDRDFPLCVQYFSADAEMLGGEALFEAIVTTMLRARATLDYVRGTRRDTPREPLAFIPPARLTLGVLHDESTWYAGVSSRHAAAQNRRPADELPTPGYHLIDLEAGVRLRSTGRHLLALRLDNLLDRSYTDHLSVVRRFPEPVSPANPARFEMPGRNLNLSYRYTF